MRGEVNNLTDGFECPKGPAYLGIKIWATSMEESADVFSAIASEIGFNITGNIDIFTSEPKQPPQENPYGYDINLTPFLA
jgi:hypothetical protein